MSKAPQGRGMFIWKIYKLFGGDYAKMLKYAQYMNLDWVAIKILDGSWRYNRILKPTGWKNYAKEFTQIFHDAGIDVHGWQYVYLYNGRREGKALREVSKEMGLKGVIMDVEGHVKHAKNQMQHVINYCQEIAKITDMPVGFSSYRYPSYHREIPYHPFLDVSTYITPQVYWMKAHNPVAQLLRSKREYADLEYGHLPFVPTGSAYSEWGWTPRDQELVDFNEAVIEEEYPGICWWRFGTAVSNGWHKLIKNMPSNYGGVPAPTPGPIPEKHYRVAFNLNIREKPSAQERDIGTLAKGSDITLTNVQGKWGKIEGWVHTDYIEPL